MVVCSQCWYWIQKIYNFKKQCFEVEQSLILYRQQHNLAVLNESHVEDFVKNRIHANNKFPRQDNNKNCGITTDDNDNDQNKSTDLISDCSENTVSVIEDPDIQDIGCLKFEADETVILNTYNDEDFLPSELNEPEIPEDDVFVEDCAVANANTDNISVDSASDTESTSEVSIENDVADLTTGQRFGSSHQGHLLRYQKYLNICMLSVMVSYKFD